MSPGNPLLFEIINPTLCTLKIFFSPLCSIGSVYIRRANKELNLTGSSLADFFKGGEKIIIRFSRVAVNALFELSQYY